MYTGSENRVKQNQVGSPLRAGSGRDTIAGPEEFNVFPPSDRFDTNRAHITGQSLSCQISFLQNIAWPNQILNVTIPGQQSGDRQYDAVSYIETR